MDNPAYSRKTFWQLAEYLFKKSLKLGWILQILARPNLLFL